MNFLISKDNKQTPKKRVTCICGNEMSLHHFFKHKKDIIHKPKKETASISITFNFHPELCDKLIDFNILFNLSDL